jgi:hypothetical protein
VGTDNIFFFFLRKFKLILIICHHPSAQQNASSNSDTFYVLWATLFVHCRQPSFPIVAWTFPDSLSVPFFFLSSFLPKREIPRFSCLRSKDSDRAFYIFKVLSENRKRHAFQAVLNTSTHNHPRPTCASGTLLKVRAFFVLTHLFHLNFCVVHNKQGYCGIQLSSKP